jgi:hypothetical protein
MAALSGEEREILYCVVTRLEIGRRQVDRASARRPGVRRLSPLTGAEGGVVKQRSH